jgi:hypothetical protein
MKTINYTGSSKMISRIVNLLNRKAPLPLDGDGDPDWGTNGQVLSTDGSGNTAWVNAGGGGSGGHTIENTSGTDLPQEDNLQFVGVYTRDDSGNDRTEVNIVRDMTAAQMAALSTAEAEGFIWTTDEDEEYFPIDAEDVKYGGSDVKTKLDSLTTEVSGKVSKTGDTMTGLLWHQPENTPAIRFRAGNASYRNFITQYTGGNEALVHATKNAITSLIFVNGEDSEAYTDSNRWMSLTPGLQIKNNKVAIGKLIGNGVTPTYTLDVGGTINSSGEITKNGNPAFAPSNFVCESFTPTANTKNAIFINSTGKTILVFITVCAEVKTGSAILYLIKNDDGNHPLTSPTVTAVDITNPQYQMVNLSCFAQLANGDYIKYYPVGSFTFGVHTKTFAY